MADIELSIKKSRAILKEAKKDREDHGPVFDGDIPEDEDKMVEEAVELVEMAIEADQKGQDHPAIAKILSLAGVEAGETDDDDEDDESGSDDEEPIEDYDDLKAGQIIRKLPKLDDDELAAVYEYEKDNKNRDAIIESLEEIAEERGLTGDDGEEDDDEVSKDYKPWNKYDSEKPAKIIAQIEGMQSDDPQFFQNILDYEEENKCRKSIIACLEETIEEKKAAADESDEGDGDEESGDEDDYLKREDLDEMSLDELEEVIEVNELEYEMGEDKISTAIVKIAEELELEYEDESDEESDESDEDEDEGEEGLGDLDWETLEQLDLPELKDIIKEKDLGMRAGTKTDLDKLRERIAEALDIAKPAEKPWKGYDKREPEQILKKLPKLDDEELAAVFAFEEENDNRDEIMDALREIAEERGLTDGEEEADEKGEEEDEGSEDGSDADASDDSGRASKKSRRKRKSDDGEEDEEAGGEPDHDELIEGITQRVEEEHFAIPAPLPENITTLPFDLTELSDKEMQQQYSANLSYFGRACYIAKIEKQLGIACKNIADDAFNDALLSIDKIDEETEKEKTATQLKAEAESSPKVRRWRKREREHVAQKESMRADSEIFKQNLDSISRVWTMRTEEVEHSGGLGTRGKAGKKASKKSARKGK